MKESKLELHRIGYNYVHANGVGINRPCGSGDYLFLYLKSNATILTAQGLEEVKEPSFLIYEKGVPQQYFDKKGPFVNDWMHFGGENLHSFFEELDIPLNRLMVLRDSKEISSMIRELCVEEKQKGRFHEEILHCRMKALFCKFSDIYHEESRCSDKLNRYRRDFNEIRNRIYSFNPEKGSPKVSEIASTINLSTSYFQHIYKQLFGVPVMNDIIKSRIEYACYMLASNTETISEVAFRCGYENKEHFTRQFKEITGYTPKQYRETR